MSVARSLLFHHRGSKELGLSGGRTCAVSSLSNGPAEQKLLPKTKSSLFGVPYKRKTRLIFVDDSAGGDDERDRQVKQAWGVRVLPEDVQALG
jgi:hypothetical protein